MTESCLPDGRRPVELGAGRVFLLDDSDAVWTIEAGRVELFGVDEAHGGRRWHLASFATGQALFGSCATHVVARMRLLASGVSGTRLLRYEMKDWHGENLAALLEDWVLTLMHSVVTELVPRTCRLVDGDGRHLVPSGETVRAEAGLRWVRHIEGCSYWLGNRDLPPIASGSAYFPLSSQTWLEIAAAAELETESTQSRFDGGTWADDLDGFYTRLFTYAAGCHEKAMQATGERIQQRIENQKQFMGDALGALASVIRAKERSVPERSAMVKDPLLLACQAIAKSAHFMVAPPLHSADGAADGDRLGDIARASGVHIRQVALKDGWWRTDSGAMLGYVAQGGAPVALLPVGGRAYDLYDPHRDTVTRVDRRLASKLEPMAYAFYRPLPARKLKVWDLLAFSGRSDIIRDLVSVVLMGTVGGLLGLVIPLATGALVDTIIPEAERAQLIQMALIALVSMTSAVIFQVVGSIAMVRLETRVDHDVQSAVWARLLSLPATFFTRYSVGDLAMRANSINSIRQTLSGVLISTLMSGVFSSFHLFLLFRYDVRFSLMALGLVGISAAVTVAVSAVVLRLQRELMAKQGRLSSLILQLLHGIAKLRVAGAEASAFFLWSNRFSDVRRTAFKMLSVQNAAGVFGIAFPTISSMMLYAAVGANAATGSSMSTGQFLAFYSAFGAFVAATTGAFGALIAALGVIPLYERAKPILETEPEAASTGRHPGELSGEIEVSHVTFRYQSEGPDVLKDLSLTIRAGEFVAIVGASGSGKSTLLRMLLGFEKPQTGAVYFDRQDLGQLDAQAVRRQLGVVLQNSQLMDGDMLTNIIGSRRLTIDDAKEAVRAVGLEDDVADMPMGLFTMVGEGGSTLSGGQRQRLLIARAIVAKPRIIFFDEATSALDNRAQAVVSESLEKLRTTRVVIAHRLSTVRRADRIYVLDQGRIVQEGTYDELVNRQGHFLDMARRQLA